MALSNSAELLFKIRADNKEAVSALKETRGEVDKLGDETAGLGNASKIASVGAAAAAASIAAIGAAAIVATRALFNMAREAGAYGAEIQKAAEQTGISAENLTALDVAAKRSGSSLSAMTDSITEFAKKVAEAAEGSKAAAADIAKFGLDPQKAINDLDGSLATVFKTIIDAPPGIRQMKLAIDAFGDSGAELIPILKSFDGDMQQLVKTAKELGLTLTDEGAASAKEFDRELTDVTLQLEGLTRQIGTAFMPVFRDMARETSDWLSKNQGEIRQWSDTFASSVEAVIRRTRDLIDELLEWRIVQQWLQIQSIPSRIIDWASGISQLRDELRKQREAERKNPFEIDMDTFTMRPKGTGRTPAPGTPDLDAQKRAAEAAAKEREKLAQRDAAAQVRILENQMKQAQDVLKQSYESFKKIFENTGDEKVFLAGFEEALTIYNTAINDILPMLLEAEGALASQTKKTAGELGLLAQEQEKRLETLRKFAAGLIADKDKEIADNAKRVNKESYEDLKARLDDEIKLREAASRSILARLERDLSAGSVNETKFLQTKITLESELLNLRIANLRTLLAASQGNADESRRITTELKVLEETRDANRFRSEKAIGDLQRNNAEALLSLKRQIAEEERRILDFRKEQERKVLVNVFESAPNRKAQREALAELVAFDIAEANRKKKQREDDLEAERRAALERVKGKENEEAQKFAIEELYRKKREISEAEFQERMKEIRENAQAQSDNINSGGFFGQIFGGLDDATGNIRDFEDVIESLGQTVEGVFMEMGRGLGNMLQQWVLLGDQSGASMKKMVAATLAGVAAQAATLAIFHLAMGIAALTPWGAAMYGPASNHFIAAAIWGSIAVGAALAGRAIAGDSFKRQTSAATGGASGSSATQRDTSAQGGAFSDKKEITIEAGRYTPFMQRQQVELTVKLDSNGVLKVLEDDARANGKFRGLVLNIAEG